jgi:hypothetical protein
MNNISNLSLPSHPLQRSGPRRTTPALQHSTPPVIAVSVGGPHRPTQPIPSNSDQMTPQKSFSSQTSSFHPSAGGLRNPAFRKISNRHSRVGTTYLLHPWIQRNLSSRPDWQKTNRRSLPTSSGRPRSRMSSRPSGFVKPRLQLTPANSTYLQLWPPQKSFLPQHISFRRSSGGLTIPRLSKSERGQNKVTRMCMGIGVMSCHLDNWRLTGGALVTCEM